MLTANTFQIWSTITGYEELASRLRLVNLSKDVFESRNARQPEVDFFILERYFSPDFWTNRLYNKERDLEIQIWYCQFILK